LGLIGCGAQSITQLHALSRVFNLEEVLYYDLSSSTLKSFPDRVKNLDLELEYVPADVATIVERSDIVCTATSIDIGAGPLFSGLNPKPHLHINAVGSDFPGKIELPLELLKKSFVCPDFHAQAVREGECQQLTAAEIAPDIIAVVKDPSSFVHVQAQLSVFDSTGISLEDLVAMELFMECAEQLELGTRISIENLTQDAKNPYDFLREDVPVKLKEAV
jgi:ornithine cyclodeaminase/alanine dehydrogenase-like protein (mu-crystallin family)